MPNDLHDRALGAYLGLAVGDALGATVEFMTPREIQQEYGTHSSIVGGGWLRLKPGDVTDDTQMCLVLGESILTQGSWSLASFAEGMGVWLKSNPVDVGNTCRRGIRRYLLDRSLIGEPSEWDAGNGACVRNLPAALATLDNDECFVRISLEQAHLTHYNVLSDEATLSLGWMVRSLLQGGGLADIRRLANDLVARHREFRFAPYPNLSSAYVVDTVSTVLHYFLNTDNFKDCLIGVVNQGGDADTTGALAGMLAGALYGSAAIPQAWVNRLNPELRRVIHRQVDGLLVWGQTPLRAC